MHGAKVHRSVYCNYPWRQNWPSFASEETKISSTNITNSTVEFWSWEHAPIWPRTQPGPIPARNAAGNETIGDERRWVGSASLGARRDRDWAYVKGRHTSVVFSYQDQDGRQTPKIKEIEYYQNLQILISPYKLPWVGSIKIVEGACQLTDKLRPSSQTLSCVLWRGWHLD